MTWQPTCSTEPAPAHHLFSGAQRERRKEKKLETPLIILEEQCRDGREEEKNEIKGYACSMNEVE